MVSSLWKGPRWAGVENIAVKDAPFEGFQNFTVR